MPFRAAIEAGVPLVMAGHAVYPAIDPDRIASQSKPVIDGLLRKELGFEGVVITDSTEAAAVQAVTDVREAAVRNVRAGRGHRAHHRPRLLHPGLPRAARRGAARPGVPRAGAGVGRARGGAAARPRPLTAAGKLYSMPVTTFGLGDIVPAFTLPDTDGAEHAVPADEAPAATVLVVTCNHCPHVVAWNPHLRAAAEEYLERGVRFLAINANDAERYPADSPEHMRRFAREQAWPMPYLYDESQDVARALGAERTPHVFVLDGEHRLAYRGAPGRRP